MLLTSADCGSMMAAEAICSPTETFSNMPLLVSAAFGISGFLLLAMTYFGFEHQWPSSYRSLADTYGMRVTARLWRLIAFRAVPVMAVCTLIGTLTLRAGSTAWFAISLACLLHFISTNGRAFVNGLVPGRPEAAINYGSYHLLAGGITAASGVIASLLLPVTSAVVPSNQSLVDSVWTAGLLAVLGGFLLRITSSGNEDSPGLGYKFDRVKRDVGIDLLDYAFEQAALQRVDPLIVRAVLAVETLQRPAWLRRAERVLGRLRPAGSYGVMQVHADRPITDKESIERFCRNHAGSTAFTSDGSSPYLGIQHQTLRAIGGNHNGDAEFTDALLEFYDWFIADCEWLVTDQNKCIGVIEKRYYARELGFRLASNAPQLEVKIGSQVEIKQAPNGWQQSAWWWLEVRASSTEHAIAVRSDSSSAFLPLDPEKVGYFI